MYTCVGYGLLICGLFLGSHPAIASSANTVHVEDLLEPVEYIDNVTCATPAGATFAQTGASTYSLTGTLTKKSVTLNLKPMTGEWDISAYSYFRIDFVNSGPGLVWIRARLDNKGALDWDNSTPSMAYVLPGERATIGFPFPRARALNDAPPIFDSQYTKPTGFRSHWKAFDPAKVIGCHLQIQSTSDAISLEDIELSAAFPYGAEANPDLIELPYLDRFGQFRALDWEGKLYEADELQLRLKEEARADFAGPDAFNAYGGWLEGPQLEATGNFRLEKYEGRWWLVDPDGRLFFSHGANSVGFGQKTPTKDRKALFEWLPDASDSNYPGVIHKGNVRYHVANLIRTYGKKWQEPARERVHQRMREWGMNTIGAWSDEQLLLDKQTPYTAIVHVGHNYSPLGHGISDPFSEDFKRSLYRGLERVKEKGLADEWCIGVFIDNEIDWKEDFARESLNNEKDRPVRRAVITQLQSKYPDIDSLNLAWGTDYAGWDAVTDPPEAETEAMAEDLSAIRRLIAAKYYQACRDAMREVLPNHLYLGSRMHKWTDEVLEEAISYADVVSLNAYEPLAGSKIPGSVDKPFLISEFHFAAPDRGVPGTGLMSVGDQTQRSRAYLGYVLDGVLDSNVVGTHWFAYADQSAAGRPGENFQIGFVDVTDKPYPEISTASRTLADRMYGYADEADVDRLAEVEVMFGSQ